MNDVRVTCDGCDSCTEAAVRNISPTSIAVALPAGWCAPGMPFTRGTVLCPACVCFDATRTTEPTTRLRAMCDRPAGSQQCHIASDWLAVRDRFPDTLYIDLPPGWRMDVNVAGDGYDVLCPDHVTAPSESVHTQHGAAE